MYDELVKSLHRCRNEAAIITDSELADIAEQAADAIESASKAYQMMADAYEAEVTTPRWISVEERLPIGGDDSGAICENVCLLMDDGTVSCGWMNGITKKVYYLNARDDVVIKAPITRVTHWMPLPSAPDHIRESTKKDKPTCKDCQCICQMMGLDVEACDLYEPPKEVE